MKNSSRRVGAFTLIELLVVITIIIILMGLLFPAFRGVQDQAKRVQAKNDLTQIVTAVNAFYTEYGKYPTTATNDVIFGAAGTSNDALFNELVGTSGAALNTRQIVFISPPPVKDTTNPRSGMNAGKFYDPWGTEYNVEIDGDYDNQITPNPYLDSDGSAGPSPLRIPVIAWSYGKDGASGTKGGSANLKGSDDVVSWQ